MPRLRLGYRIFVGPDGRIWSTGGQGGCCYVPEITAVPTLISANQSIAQVFMDNDTTNVGIGSSSQTGIEIHLAPGTALAAITAGPDGNMYFTDVSNNAIGRVPTSGTTLADITEIPAPSVGAFLRDLVTGPDGNVWFTESGVDKIAKLAL